ncbi:hypothetical protein Ciccas_010320 [Cichlidogyrus casuarinus]|uniref:C2H2-type domain-containing protein n=1 Tax=Cichlidogyrus casuarinus TaxID=1844966 RepID=A0ABD2PUG9_9PLAT
MESLGEKEEARTDGDSSSEHSSYASGTNQEDLMGESSDSVSFQESDSPNGSGKTTSGKQADNRFMEPLLRMSSGNNPLLSNLLFKPDTFKSIIDLIGNRPHPSDQTEPVKMGEDSAQVDNEQKKTIVSMIDQFLQNSSKEQEAVETFKCVMCRDSFPSNVTLFQHIISQHSNKDQQPSLMGLERMLTGNAENNAQSEQRDWPGQESPAATNLFGQQTQALLRMLTSSWSKTPSAVPLRPPIQDKMDSDNVNLTTAKLFHHIHKRINSNPIPAKDSSINPFQNNASAFSVGSTLS